MHNTLDQIKRLSQIYKGVLEKAINDSKTEADKAEVYKQVKENLGSLLQERAIADLNFLMKSNNLRLNSFDYTFIKDPDIKSKLEFNNIEAIRCVCGLNRDGSDFFEFIRVTVIQIEIMLSYQHCKKNIFPNVKPGDAIVTRIYKNGKSRVFYYYQSKDKKPILESLLVFFVSYKFSCLNKSLLDSSSEGIYIEKLLQIKDIRNMMSHDGVPEPSKYWISEIINQDFSFVSSIHRDIYDFVRNNS